MMSPITNALQTILLHGKNSVSMIMNQFNQAQIQALGNLEAADSAYNQSASLTHCP